MKVIILKIEAIYEKKKYRFIKKLHREDYVLKKLIDKNIFDSNGYVVLDTELINNPLFNDLINEFEDTVNFELKFKY